MANMSNLTDVLTSVASHAQVRPNVATFYLNQMYQLLTLNGLMHA